MSFKGGSGNASPPRSALSCGPGWHWFDPPAALGYSSGDDWVEVIDLPLRSDLTVEQITDCFLESGIEPGRAQQRAIDLEEAHELLDQEAQRLTALSAFRNAFMRSAAGGFQDAIATFHGVDLVRPVTRWYDDESLADAELVDSGSIVLTVYGAKFEGTLGSRTIECGRVDDIEFSLQLGTMHIDGWADEWYLRNVTANGLAALYAIQHIDSEIAVRGTVRYVGGWLDDPDPDPGDLRSLLQAVKRVRARSPQASSYLAALRASAAASKLSPPPDSAGLSGGGAMPIVEFFLDKESTPMPLCVVHDTDGPDELEVMLGTFSSNADAMSAVDTVRQFLQEDKMRWASVAEALDAAQVMALRCRGNHGLPARTILDAEVVDSAGRQDLAANVLASIPFATQRSRAQRVTLTDDQVGGLIRRLVAAPGNRIDQPSAAKALGVPLAQLSGALPMVQRLLNVDQYPVLDRDADGSTIVLDLALLKEQFGVTV